MANCLAVDARSFILKPRMGLLLLLVALMMSSCGIFRRGCHCPKVSYVAPHQGLAQKKV